MCGLNYIDPRLIRQWRLDPEAVLDLMNQRLRHRGTLPGESLVTSTYGLGHVRLPIVGLADGEGDQPVKIPGGSAFAFVGELVNYKDVSPDSPSDTRALASKFFGDAIYFKHKPSPPWDELQGWDGFWSVVHCGQRGETAAMVDPLAKKPLYHHIQSGAISSEISPLLIFEPMGDLKFDDGYFAHVGKFGYSIDPSRTPFRNIRKIPAGHVLVSQGPGVPSQYARYCNIPPLGAEPTHEMLYQFLLGSVCRRMSTSALPIAILFSGGLDSSIILYLVIEGMIKGLIETRPITLFHVGEEELENLGVVDQLKANTLGIDINLVKLHSAQEPDLDAILLRNESPVDLGSMIPQWTLGQAVKGQGFHVVLGGDGADELFGGYRRQNHFDAQNSDVFDELVQYHLPRLDKLMMAHTVEMRSPFLAWEVCSLALQLPYSERINKKFLRDTFRNRLPDEVVDRKKVPLKSKNVLQGGEAWRYHLMNRFKEVFNREHQTRDR
jgi:asparagine synthetase B (glutamine-hydrolysing)